MTTAFLPLRQRAYQAIIGDILDLTLAQPHQVLLSTGSVALMAQFAAHGGVVDPLVGYCIAGGVEWAYLRGLASNAKAPTHWATALNWSAFAIVVLWGVLWVALQYGAIKIEGVTGAWAWALAAAHVVPVGWLSLCAAMTHSAAAGIEAREANAEREWRRELEREREKRLMDIETKAIARRTFREIDAAPMPAASNARDARPASINADPVCPKCGTSLDAARWRAARRWGHCATCKE